VPGLGDAVLPAPSTDRGGVTVGLRPNHLRLADGESHTVELSEQLGGVSYHYLVTADGHRIIVEAHDQSAPRPGSRVGLTFDPASAYFFDEKTGARLR
jgi:lactose/L-arabinose transport system ATP-binding protein